MIAILHYIRTNVDALKLIESDFNNRMQLITCKNSNFETSTTFSGLLKGLY